MKTTLLILLTSILFLSFTTDNQLNYKKYDIEKGSFLVNYKTTFPEDIDLNFEVTFTDYGNTENYNCIGKTCRFNRILKIDSIQHLFVTDSMTIKSSRTADIVFEKLILSQSTDFENADLTFKRIKATKYLNRKCEKIEFLIKSTGTKGEAIVWKNIPLWIKTNTEGIIEETKVTNLKEEIDIEKVTIADYVDNEE